MEEGRYEAARSYAKSAVASGSPDAARYLEMIAARAAVLEPGWTPDLSDAADDLRALPLDVERWKFVSCPLPAFDLTRNSTCRPAFAVRHSRTSSSVLRTDYVQCLVHRVSRIR